jgi:hypothetical protein
MLLSGAGHNSGQSSDYRVVSAANGEAQSKARSSGRAEPHLSSFPITKDPQVCDPDSHKTRDLERLLIGPQSDIATRFDVLTEKKVERPVFSEPRTGEKQVNVGESATAVANFVISAK